MVVVFGGLYQGKKEFIKNNYHFEDNDFCNLLDQSLDLSKKVIEHGELLANYDINVDDLKDKIIIITNIFEGVVPVDKEERLFREKAGLFAQKLVKHSDEVYEVYFGIAKRVK